VLTVSISVTKEDLFALSGDEAGNVPICIDKIKKTFCSVAGHRDNVQIACHVLCNTSPYEEPNKNTQQTLKSEINVGFDTVYKLLIIDNSEPVDSAIDKDGLQCPNETACFKWATVYHNIPTILSELNVGI